MAFYASILFATSSHAEVISFAAVRDSSLPLDQYVNGNYSYTLSESRIDSGIASVAIATGDAMSQTALGLNKVAVENNAQVDDEFLRSVSIGGPFAVAISAWADQFTIIGGSGEDTAKVSVSITGEFGPKPEPSYGAGGSYYLFVADSNQIANLLSSPFEFLVNNDLSSSVLSLEQNVLKPGYTDPGESLPPDSLFGGTLTGNIAFSYGEPFYLVSVLAGSANDYGILNAFNSAHFGISSPTDAVITTGSGTIYAAAVPEPDAIVLFAGGLVILTFVTRHRRKHIM